MAAIVAVAALIALGSAQSAAARATQKCSLKGSKTVRQLGRVRIYRFHHGIYGCSSRYGKRVRLTSGADRIGCFTDTYAEASNSVVAVAHDANVNYALLGSWNMKTGKRLRRYRYEYDSPGCGSVYRLVTDASGSLAWIALSTEHENGATVVLKDDSSGFTQLDYQAPPLCDPMTDNCGDMIDTGYLTASDGMVFWEANGAIKSAPFD